MQIRRNYEVEQINRSYNNESQVNNWLTSQETSLKKEKLQISDSKIIPNNIYQLSNSKKNVSWSNSDEIQTFSIDDEEDDNIFSKLKKVSNNNINQTNISQEQNLITNNISQGNDLNYKIRLQN